MLCGWLIGSACSLDWDALDPRKGGGEPPVGGSGGTVATGGGGGPGGSVGGGGAGPGEDCSVDADCSRGLFCGCASIGVVGVTDGSEESGPLTISTPTSVTSGDVMVAAIAVRPDNAMAVAPPGWTPIRVDTSPDDVTENLYSFVRVAEDGEAPSQTWTFSISHSGAVGGIVAFRGADATDPIGAHAGQSLSGPTDFTGLVVDAPSVTTRAAESMIVTLYSATSSGSWQPPAGMTEAVDRATGVDDTAGEALLMSYAPQATAGATGVKSATAIRHDAGTAVSQTIAVKPLCASSSCTAQQVVGWTCSAANQCQSGSCVQNHCCDGPCGVACEACDVPGSLGSCSPVSVGTVGDPDCTPFSCNGTLATCPDTCSSHAECAGGFFCNTVGSCEAQKSNGLTCSSDLQCLSGNCVNGYCCNDNCGGSCDACNLAGNLGMCTQQPAGATGSPSCSPYLCSGASSGCPTSCVGDGDCATGFACVGGSCI